MPLSVHIVKLNMYAKAVAQEQGLKCQVIDGVDHKRAAVTYLLSQLEELLSFDLLCTFAMVI